MPGTSSEPGAPLRVPRVHLVPTSRQGERLDRFLAEAERTLSRSAIQELIEQGYVRLNDTPVRASRRVKAGDRIVLTRPARAPRPPGLSPEPIPLRVLHEDEFLAVIAKPAGMVVHPAVGHRTGTLVHALLHRYASLPVRDDAERPGIVHRLDKGTSGLLLVARTEAAHRNLARQIEAREVSRCYRAIVWGHPRPAKGRIEGALARHPKDRKRIAVVARGGRFAATNYETLRGFAYASELRVTLETGRTHQIRVHLAHRGHPVFGDPDYGGRRVPMLKLPAGMRARAALLLAELGHQALHAETLGFRHPMTGAWHEFTEPPPEDFETALRALACEC